ncbi:MAG: TetR/AcrR family transcriptional regulator [Pseudomonadota bacterium]
MRAKTYTLATKEETEGKHKVGRPRQGTESERSEALLDAATAVFMRQGYGLASIGQIAQAAGVSTRTIYERFANKAELLVAVIRRLMGRELGLMIESGTYDDEDPEIALTAFGLALIERATSTDAIGLFRMGVADSERFPDPDLARQIYEAGPWQTQRAVASYLSNQCSRGRLTLEDPLKAASLFIHLISSEPREQALFKCFPDDGTWNPEAHVRSVVRLFLRGTLPRAAIPKKEQ